jgi:hypothetical protein
VRGWPKRERKHTRREQHLVAAEYHAETSSDCGSCCDSCCGSCPRWQLVDTWRPRIWIGAIVVWQAGLWTQEPVVVLSATGIAIALLLLGWCASGQLVAEHETGFCLWDCDDEPYDDQGMDEDFCCCGYARAYMLAMTVLGHLVAAVISVTKCGGIGDHQSVLAPEEPFLQCGAAALWGIAPIAVFIMYMGLLCVTCPCWCDWDEFVAVND